MVMYVFMMQKWPCSWDLTGDVTELGATAVKMRLNELTLLWEMLLQMEEQYNGNIMNSSHHLTDEQVQIYL